MNLKNRIISAVMILFIAAGCAVSKSQPNTASNDPQGIHKIQHVVIIMQENRSFDSYFGTYPGADGIPMKNGVPTVCVPDPKSLPIADSALLAGTSAAAFPLTQES